MSISIEIPDDIMETVKLPPARAKRELTWKMAFSLYQRRLLSTQQKSLGHFSDH